jgi:hypothetical protein
LGSLDRSTGIFSPGLAIISQRAPGARLNIDQKVENPMPEDNKHNLVYFEGPSMRDLYKSMEDWQNDNGKRFLSASIHQDGGVFCCIALTTPMEVTIVSSDFMGKHEASVDILGRLFVVEIRP